MYLVRACSGMYINADDRLLHHWVLAGRAGSEEFEGNPEPVSWWWRQSDNLALMAVREPNPKPSGDQAVQLLVVGEMQMNSVQGERSEPCTLSWTASKNSSPDHSRLTIMMMR